MIIQHKQRFTHIFVACTALGITLPACAVTMDTDNQITGDNEYSQATAVVHDTDGDGTVSEYEIAVQLLEDIRVIDDRHRDADGEVDRAAAERDYIRYFHALSGDIDGNGVVGQGDMDIVVRNTGRASGVLNFEGDADLDGDVDGDDLLAVKGVLGQEIRLSEVQMLIGIDGLDDIVALGPGDPPESHAPPGHHEYFSDSWTDHFWLTSQNFPPDHFRDITYTWDPGQDGHGVDSSKSQWPPNHGFDLSKWWTTFPPGHKHRSSRLMPPGHHHVFSGEWPRPHTHVTSRSWPPSHDQSKTKVGMPTDHIPPTSASWGDHDTAVTLSRFPPNHLARYSSSWPIDHQAGVSLTWPPSHYEGPSYTWPPNNPPWPPNHFLDESKKWGMPEHNTIISETENKPGQEK